MNVFILYAHPEPQKSFQAELLKRSIATFEQEGHQVQVSDLYSMKFNPVATEHDFKERRFPDRLQYDREQKHAVKNNAFADDIQQEIDKILWCDLFIVQFPLYWFSMPAIMKGWFDRVFVNSLIYGAGKRFEHGGLKGKKAMICTSTGGYEAMFKSKGLLGDIDVVLYPIHHGIFAYTGLATLPPFIAWSPVYAGDEACEQYCKDYEVLIRNIENIDPLPGHIQSDFDDNFELKAGVTPKTVGHKI